MRSQIAGRLRSLAASPLATCTVVRPIRVVPAPAPKPPLLLLDDGFVVMLNVDESAALFHRSYDGSGGYQARTRKWQTRPQDDSGAR